MAPVGKLGENVWEMAGLRRVILVDDNDIVRDLMRAMLERDGFEVADAASPLEALRLAGAGGRVDLLVTDVVMPGMNGLELADRILELHPEASVLFTSGHADERILAPGTVPYGAAFLAKPFTMADLVDTAEEVFATADVLAGRARVA
jgi:two-component system cell cycle sensor histidine kinase/response regulator CckA